MKNKWTWLVVFLVASFFLVSTAACGKKATSQAEIRMIYHCPMHPSYTSDKPGDCPICGMKLAPVGKKAGISESQAAPTNKIMYRSTMNPNEVSDKPGKDSMGMDMVPFEVEAPAEGEMGSVPGLARITITPERRKLLNLKVTTAEIKKMSRQIRTSARIVPDETKLFRVTTKIDGYIEKLFVNATGQAVRRGQPLLSIYSPELLASQQEFLSALSMASQLRQSSDPVFSQSLVNAARRRLKLWDITDSQIERLQKTGQVERAVTLVAPANGHVYEKMVLPGQKIMAGEPLMVVADLADVWAEADLYESDVAYVKVGMEADLTLPFLPGKVFKGRISFLNPFLDAASRTFKARLEIANPDLLLKPDMYGDILLFLDLGDRLAIPESAVMRSGERNYVFVSGSDWRLTPVQIQIGIQSGEDLEVISGLNRGDQVVVTANFLVDSESSLKAALQAIGEKK